MTPDLTETDTQIHTSDAWWCSKLIGVTQIHLKIRFACWKCTFQQHCLLCVLRLLVEPGKKTTLWFDCSEYLIWLNITCFIDISSITVTRSFILLLSCQLQPLFDNGTKSTWCNCLTYCYLYRHSQFTIRPRTNHAVSARSRLIT